MTKGILLSGGMDSAALAYLLRPAIAFTIDYGQVSAKGELRAATHFATELGIQHEIITVDCRSLGSGDLAGSQALAVAPVPEWWPFRNQLLATMAAARAVPLSVQTLLFGSVASDKSHVDGRPEFFFALNALLSMQEGGVGVEAPAMNLSAAELIRQSGIPMSMLAWSHSCHRAEFACGSCRGCNKRENVLVELQR